MSTDIVYLKQEHPKGIGWTGFYYEVIPVNCYCERGHLQFNINASRKSWSLTCRKKERPEHNRWRFSWVNRDVGIEEKIDMQCVNCLCKACEEMAKDALAGYRREDGMEASVRMQWLLR